LPKALKQLLHMLGSCYDNTISIWPWKTGLFQMVSAKETKSRR